MSREGLRSSSSLSLGGSSRRRKGEGVRSWENEVQDLLDEPLSSVCAAVFALVTMVLIVISATMLIFPNDSRKCGSGASSKSFYDVFESVACAFFTVELFLRLSVAESLKRFLGDWYTIFDILALVPCWNNVVFGYVLGFKHVACGTLASLLRALRMCRLLKLGRKYEGGIVIMRALKLSTPALSVAFFFLFVSVIVFSTFLFFAEKLDVQKVPAFYSIPHAIWFMTVTMTTVGYGEVYPLSVAGRCVTSVAMLFGVLFLSMPLAIVGNNFCMVWDDKERVVFVEKIRQQLAIKNLDVDHMHRAFDMMKNQHDNALSFRGFREALNMLQIQMPPHHLATLWRTLDTNDKGDVNLTDFVELMDNYDDPDDGSFMLKNYSNNRKHNLLNPTGRAPNNQNSSSPQNHANNDNNNDENGENTLDAAAAAAAKNDDDGDDNTRQNNGDVSPTRKHRGAYKRQRRTPRRWRGGPSKTKGGLSRLGRRSADDFNDLASRDDADFRHSYDSNDRPSSDLSPERRAIAVTEARDTLQSVLAAATHLRDSQDQLRRAQRTLALFLDDTFDDDRHDDVAKVTILAPPSHDAFLPPVFEGKSPTRPSSS